MFVLHFVVFALQFVVVAVAGAMQCKIAAAVAVVTMLCFHCSSCSNKMNDNNDRFVCSHCILLWLQLHSSNVMQSCSGSCHAMEKKIVIRNKMNDNKNRISQQEQNFMFLLQFDVVAAAWWQCNVKFQQQLLCNRKENHFEQLDE